MTSLLLLLGIGAAAGAATLLGGYLALRFADRVHLVLGFSAGAVIGVALLDLLPEAMRSGAPAIGGFGVAAAVAGGFLAYLVVDRAFLIGGAGETSHRGHLGAGSLTVHSLLDGFGIGLGFQVSTAVGAVLALAVLAHDLADGMNTVNLSVGGAHSRRATRAWLAADAVAPIVGIGLSRLVRLPDSALAPLLAVFAGFFLYIGASELLPESHHRHPKPWTTVATVLGVVLIGVVVRLAGGGGLG